MSTSLSRQIVHLDMDAFFVSVERARNPALRGVPVIVGGKPGSRGVVAAASYEARAFGIHSAMPIGEAVRRCPHAVFLEGSFDRYLEASAAVDEIVRRSSPVVEWVSIDEAYLDLTGTRRALGHARQTAERIQNEIRIQLSLDASCGIGTSKVVAKISSAIVKPHGLLYVLPGYEARFLAPLPIERLPGIGPHAARRLHEIGIRALGQLALLDSSILQQVLGRAGPVLARHATGLDDSPVLADTLPRSISKETTFSSDISDRESLTSTLQQLTESAAHRLRSEGLFARTVTVKIRYHDFTTETRSHTLREATALDGDLLPAARGLLVRALRPQKSVRLVGVSFSGLLQDGRQLSLFPLRDDKRADRLASSVDRVRERFGFGALLTGTSVERPARQKR